MEPFVDEYKRRFAEADARNNRSTTMSNLSLGEILRKVYNGQGADPDDQQKVLVALGPADAAKYGIYPNETVPTPPPTPKPAPAPKPQQPKGGKK
jgi:hypothetical protein